MSAHRQRLLLLAAQTLTALLAFNLTVELVLLAIFGPLAIPAPAQLLMPLLPSCTGAAGLVLSKWKATP